jgi:hypothetical protein
VTHERVRAPAGLVVCSAGVLIVWA